VLKRIEYEKEQYVRIAQFRLRFLFLPLLISEQEK